VLKVLAKVSPVADKGFANRSALKITNVNVRDPTLARTAKSHQRTLATELTVVTKVPAHPSLIRVVTSVNVSRAIPEQTVNMLPTRAKVLRVMVRERVRGMDLTTSVSAVEVTKERTVKKPLAPALE